LQKAQDLQKMDFTEIENTKTNIPFLGIVLHNTISSDDVKIQIM